MDTSARVSTAESDSGLASDLLLSPLASPEVRRSRRENVELRQLNNRLAAYIQRVQALEGTKAALLLRLGRCEEDSSRDLGSLRSSYERELDKARQALEQRALRESALQAAVDKLREEHRQLLARNTKRENELSSAVARVGDLVAQLNSREADLATALHTQRSLQKELQESRNQATSLKELLESSRNELQNEKLKRAELENQGTSFQEQVEFLKSFHENELKNEKQFYERRIQEIVSGYEQENEAKLVNSLQELRKENEEQIKKYKDQVEQNFQAKVQNALLYAEKKHDFAATVQEELKKTKLKVDNLSSQNAELRARIKELETKIKDLQRGIDTERDSSKRCLAEKNREMAEMQQQMQSQLDKYEDLLDVKMSLDFEINAYKVLLEGEEKRLKLSKFSAESREGERRSDGSWTTVSHGHRLFLQGRKRKRVSAKTQAHSLSFKVLQRASSSGSISIEDIDMEGNFIKIKNNSDKEIADGMITYLERGEGEGEVEDAAEQTKLGIHSQLTWFMRNRKERKNYQQLDEIAKKAEIAPFYNN
ncbi:lamin-L(III)-like [Thamnophis elegans]|uniref:lamin-L(III)-like n=1 Tax=Thamnophis elegans TaxID=35005 RepID=UPI001376840D|nr:lamin-L(III)-like [Thamnophis elegans]